MSIVREVTHFDCPKCSAALEPISGPHTLCSACGWIGDVYLYRPLAAQAQGPEEALPEDATCVHHPTKRAVAVCAGAGDYVCSLCAIEIDGETYSAQFLNKGGKEKLSKAFDRYLERPDRAVATYLVVTLLLSFAAIITVPVAIYYFVKWMRVRKQDALLRRVAGPVSITIAVLGIVAFVLLGGFVVVAMLGGV